MVKPSSALCSTLWGSCAGKPFCLLFLGLHDLPWAPKGRFELLIIKVGTAKKLPEARLKVLENLIKTRRPPETRLGLKVGLKLNIQKTKIMASGPITSWQIDGETVETVADFIFWGAPKSLKMVTTAMKLKDAYSLEAKLWPTKTVYFFFNFLFFFKF